MEIVVTPRRDVGLKLLSKRPVQTLREPGDIVVVKTSNHIRRKWLEIICFLMSPTRRDKYREFEFYNEACRVWSPKLEKLYIEFCKGVIAQKDLEAEVLSSGLVLESLPATPTNSNKSVFETWVWSKKEKQRFGIAVVDETPLSSSAVDSLRDREELVSARGVVSIRNKNKFDYSVVDPALVSLVLDERVVVEPDHSTVYSSSSIIRKT